MGHKWNRLQQAVMRQRHRVVTNQRRAVKEWEQGKCSWAKVIDLDIRINAMDRKVQSLAYNKWIEV